MNDSVNKMAHRFCNDTSHKPENFKEVVESFYAPSYVNDDEYYVYNNTTTFYKRVVGEMTLSFMDPYLAFNTEIKKCIYAPYCYSGSFVLWCALHAIGKKTNWYYADIDIFIRVQNPNKPLKYNEHNYYKIINNKKINVIETIYNVENIIGIFNVSCCKIALYSDRIIISQDCIYALLTGLNICGMPHEMVLLSGEQVINIASERAKQIQYIIDKPYKIFNDKKYCDNKTSNVMTVFKNIYFIESEQFNECVEHNGVRWCIKQHSNIVEKYVNFIFGSDLLKYVSICNALNMGNDELLEMLFEKHYNKLITADEEEQIIEKIKRDLRSMLYYGCVPERIIHLIKGVNVGHFYKFKTNYCKRYHIYNNSIMKYKKMLKYKSRGFRFYKRGFYV